MRIGSATRDQKSKTVLDHQWKYGDISLQTPTATNVIIDHSNSPMDFNQFMHKSHQIIHHKPNLTEMIAV
jgi:hypothetical protein